MLRFEYQRSLRPACPLPCRLLPGSAHHLTCCRVRSFWKWQQKQQQRGQGKVRMRASTAARSLLKQAERLRG